jgi:hypothetical protein
MASQGRYKNFSKRNNRFLAISPFIHIGRLKNETLMLRLYRYGTGRISIRQTCGDNASGARAFQLRRAVRQNRPM